MKQSEEQFRHLAVAYAHPDFWNSPIKDQVLILKPEAYPGFSMFVNTDDPKPAPQAELPVHALSREQYAMGLAVSEQAGIEKWF